MRQRLIPAITTLMLLLAACAGIGGSESGDDLAFEEASSNLSGGPTGHADAPNTTAAPAARATAEGGDDTARQLADKDLGDGGTAPDVAPLDTGRDIIYTAEITVAVTDVATASSKAVQTIQAMGGLVFGQQTTDDPPTSTIVFKVLPEDFQTALDRLGSIGKLRNQTISADDVTERVVDLKSRIATAEISVKRLQDLLGQAADIENVVALEQQLLQRETDLETLRGQLRTIETQVALATIYLTITEATTTPQVRVDVSAYLGHDEGAACPGGGGINADRGSEITLCFEIVNVGDTSLTKFTLRDPILDLDIDDLIPVLGTKTDTLEPGQSIVLAAEVVAERRLRTQTKVTAVALDEDGTEIDRPVVNTASIVIDAVNPVGIPTFEEGLTSSWRMLIDLGRWALLVLGTLIPFAWIPVLGWWLLRRRRHPENTTPEPEKESVNA